MLRSRFISFLVLAFISLSIFTAYNFDKTTTLKTSNKFVVTYMPNISGIAVYEELSSNTMKCNLTTVSIIISNMLSDNYSIARDISEGHMLDITVSKDEEEHRILYNRKTRDYLCMSRPYLKNYVPQTYIHVE